MPNGIDLSKVKYAPINENPANYLTVGSMEEAELLTAEAMENIDNTPLSTALSGTVTLDIKIPKKKIWVKVKKGKRYVYTPKYIKQSGKEYYGNLIERLINSDEI